ncbi:polysaccharide pyruvyl transferase family protein [Klebsiella quasipneumoniae]|uniref:polysaccharide pyruvyl transferase family protein n=1 Tax=Klebsiella quasipneumoniae TaxID=1463165 RepID=UPI00214F002D|nr:polysaccharide pyruvyl transferase family protein [Klebsiella quasipneumoniae]MCR3944060.1 polysaccharide pyruvyl transferase family protein [Klebsiella quasipneumoniae]
MSHMIELKNNLNIILNAIPPGSEIILLDTPLHLNVGDVLIYKGQLQFFKEHHIKIISEHSDKASKSFIVKNHRKIPRNAIIVLTGGGNFGDLYQHHQTLRETVCKYLPNNKIVQLPQTAHFENQSKLLESSKIFRTHKDIVMFARDDSTFEIFSNYFSDNVYKCPDMAHALYGIYPKQTKEMIKNNVMYMIRNDKEGSQQDKNYASCVKEDWDTICNINDKNKLKILLFLEKLNRATGLNLFDIESNWNKYTDAMLVRINNYFMSFDEVITSRMHGHILCCLLEVKTKVIDNSYGKNRGYYDSWTKYVPNCELITN